MFAYIAALFVSIVLLFIHLAGLNGLYFAMPLFDIVTHVAGSLAVGFLVYGLFSSYRQDMTHKRLAVVLGTLVISLAWENFELYFNITGYEVGSTIYYWDTLKDLVVALIGGYFAAAMADLVKNAFSRAVSNPGQVTGIQ